MIVPNVIIPGAQKSGTTSLCAFLEQHPACAISDPKEPNFFSREANVGRLEEFQRCFRHVDPARHRVIVDGTTTYMADPRIGQRIHDMLGPDLKFVFTLRSPARRAYSGYLHMLKRGHERRTAEEVFLSLPDDAPAAELAERAAVEEAARQRRVIAWPYRRQYDDVLWNFRYFGNSLFAEQVALYDRLFGPDRVLVLLLEDMIRDLPTVSATLADFLGIDPAGMPKTLPRENETKIPKTGSLIGIAIEQARRIKRGNFVLVRRMEGQAPPKAPTAIDAKLRPLYAGETAYWSERLGRDLSNIW